MSYTKFQNLNLSDDFLFAKVMEDETILRPVVEKILDIRIREMTIVQSQRMIEIEPDSKGVRLDIMADDAAGSRYTVEMQNENEYNIGRRSELVKLIHAKVCAVKQSKVREAEYMKLQERDRNNFQKGWSEGLRKGRSEGLREGRSEGLREGRLLYMIRMTRALIRQENGTNMLKNLPEEDAEIVGKIAGLILENEHLSDEEILKKISVQQEADSAVATY